SMICDPRFDYGRAKHEARVVPEGATFVSQSMRLLLRSDVPITVRDNAAVAEFTLRAGETATFVLEELRLDSSPSASEDYAARSFKETSDFWRRWIARSSYRGRWREMVNRSALTLKLLTSRTYGSIVAAPTFGLPEHIGGVRNWDYRYAWIRDG